MKTCYDYITKAKKINLAFQGGGAHGAVTWGVADRLLHAVSPLAICGVEVLAVGVGVMV